MLQSSQDKSLWILRRKKEEVRREKKTHVIILNNLLHMLGRCDKNEKKNWKIMNKGDDEWNRKWRWLNGQGPRVLETLNTCCETDIADFNLFWLIWGDFIMHGLHKLKCASVEKKCVFFSKHRKKINYGHCEIRSQVMLTFEMVGPPVRLSNRLAAYPV